MKAKPSKPVAYQVVDKAGKHVVFDYDLTRAKSFCQYEGDHIVPLYAAFLEQNVIVPPSILAQVFNKNRPVPFSTNPDGSVDMIVYLKWLHKTWLEGVKVAEQTLACCPISKRNKKSKK